WLRRARPSRPRNPIPARMTPGGAGTALLGRRAIWSWTQSCCLAPGAGATSATSSWPENRVLNDEASPFIWFSQLLAVAYGAPIPELPRNVPFDSSFVLPAVGGPSVMISHRASWNATESLEPVNPACPQALW